MTTSATPSTNQNPQPTQGAPQGPQGAPLGSQGGPQGPPGGPQGPPGGPQGPQGSPQGPLSEGGGEGLIEEESDDMTHSIEQEKRMHAYFAADAAALAADPAAAAAAVAAAAKLIAAAKEQAKFIQADTTAIAPAADKSAAAADEATTDTSTADTAAEAAATDASAEAAAAAAAAGAASGEPHRCVFRLFRINCSSYYSVCDLKERLPMLTANSVCQLCKTIVVENTKHAGPEDRLNSRYYLVVLQSQDKLNGERVKDLIKAENAKVGRRLGNKKLNFNFCQSFEALTGFKRNGVTPFNCRTSIPVIISLKLFSIQHSRVFLGGGAPDLKIEVPLIDLVRLTNPIVGIVS